MQPHHHSRPVPLKHVFLLGALVLLSSSIMAADLAREQRIAAQIRDTLIEGEPIELEAGGQRFLGVYMASERPSPHGTALILHGRGGNPDWMDVIHPLRVGLPQYGWHTLAIQLPLASAGAGDREWETTIPASLPRLEAALSWLEARGQNNIVLISHSFGTHAAARLLADKQLPAIHAWVGIGMSVNGPLSQSDIISKLQKIRVPVLDLYGERDLTSVTRSAKQRRLAARSAGNDAYQQRKIAGADHFFHGQDELLLSVVRSWLAKIAGNTR